jgi:hypothetical protein
MQYGTCGEEVYIRLLTRMVIGGVNSYIGGLTFTQNFYIRISVSPFYRNTCGVCLATRFKKHPIGQAFFKVPTL